jgi:hypothetical protein
MQTLNFFEIICHMSDIHTKILDVLSDAAHPWLLISPSFSSVGMFHLFPD